jgi:hypothetical protein
MEESEAIFENMTPPREEVVSMELRATLRDF